MATTVSAAAAALVPATTTTTTRRTNTSTNNNNNSSDDVIEIIMDNNNDHNNNHANDASRLRRRRHRVVNHTTGTNRSNDSNDNAMDVDVETVVINDDHEEHQPQPQQTIVNLVDNSATSSSDDSDDAAVALVQPPQQQQYQRQQPRKRPRLPPPPPTISIDDDEDEDSNNNNNNNNNNESNTTTNENNNWEVQFVRKTQPSYTTAILEVYPDADLVHIRTLLTKYQNNVVMVLHHMTELGYTKTKTTTATHGGDPNGGGGEGSPTTTTSIVSEDDYFMTAPPAAAEAAALALQSQQQQTVPVEPIATTMTSEYIELASEQLLCDFPFLSKYGARSCLQQYSYRYAICHDRILTLVIHAIESSSTTSSANSARSNNNTSTTTDKENSVATTEDVQYQQTLDCINGKPLTTYQTQCFMQQIWNSRNSRSSQQPLRKHIRKSGMARKQQLAPPTIIVDNGDNDNDIVVVSSGTTTTTTATTNNNTSSSSSKSYRYFHKELHYVMNKFRNYMSDQQLRRTRIQQTINARRNHTAMECQCCYDTYAMECMIGCRNQGHLFCIYCIQNHVQHMVYGQENLGISSTTKQPATELQCLYGDECTSGFTMTSLQTALSRKTYQKYERVQLQMNVQLAGVTLAKCPKCEYALELPTTQRVLDCPSCQYASCRECGEPSHIPYRCDEIETTRTTQGRLIVEEAMAAVKIRKCPTCKKPFIKSDGCNKITCGCGTKSCYVCQAKVKDYTHYCQTPHCQHQNCKKCPLYTNAEEDDLRAMREAGYAAAAKVQEQAKVAAITTAKTKDGVAPPPTTNAAGIQIDVDGILNAK